ncbi:MAG: helix-turn-helix transcriptional regulator [Pseudomonadota bacterium]
MNLTSRPLPNFGLRLRRQRRAAGLKQLAMAQELGVDQATISRWEAGRQIPEQPMQDRAMGLLSRCRRDDAALRRLVEQSSTCVHLVEEATHVCLGYSAARAKDWRVSPAEYVGTSLWQFATEEIQRAEMDLGDTDWWQVQMPQPRLFRTGARAHPGGIRISAGYILWERMYLADGTPVRLVTGTR